MKKVFRQKQTTILSAAFIIMVTYGLSSLLGFLRSRLLSSYFFGERVWQLDAYFASFVIPDTVFQLLVTGALSAAFIPVFTKYYHRQPKQGWRFASMAINLVLTFFLISSLIIFVFARPLSRLVAPGYSIIQINLMAQLTRLMLLAQIFFAVSSFFTGILQSHQHFLVPAIAPIMYNLGIIFGIIFLSPYLQIFGPAVGVVIGAFLHFFIQLPFVHKLGWRYQPAFSFRHGGIKEMKRLMLPRALALGVGQIENFLAVFLTASLVAGSLSIFKFARQLYVLPMNLFGVTFAQAAFPSLANQAARQATQKFKQVFCSSLRQLVFFVLPAAVIVLVLRIPLVRLVFGAKQFPWQATLLTGRVLAVFALSIVAQAVNQLLIRSFYALHNTKTPFLVAVLSAIFNVFLSLFLVKTFHWGVLGLAAAVSLTNLLQALILVVLLYRRLFGFDGRELIIDLIKMLVSAALTAVCLWLPMRLIDQFLLDTTRTIGLAILSLVVFVIGGLVYLLTASLLKLKEVSLVIRIWRRLVHFQSSMATKVEVKETSSLPPTPTQ
jgi:putative peptidoglycan lipid II flippase